MTKSLLGILTIVSRAYPVLALMVCALLLPPGYLAITLPLLGSYIYVGLRWPRSRAFMLLPLFLAFALSLLFSPITGVGLSFLVALPVLPLMDHNLRQFALRYQFAPGGKGRRPTRLSLTLTLTIAAVAVVAWALNSWGLLLTCGLVAAYILAVIVWGLAQTRGAPARAEIVTRRAVAGQLASNSTKLVKPSSLAGQLRLKSAYPWLSVNPEWFIVDGRSAEIEVSFTPPLAGPTRLVCSAAFLDPWGLVQTDFELVLADLLVIPRARYAEWLARRYLAVSRLGRREAMSSTTAAQRTMNKGVEFYGIRTYQPGDSARSIDWKHALKLHRLVVREFLDSGVESAVLLVNLSVSDEEDKDKLAYTLIMTALTLAQENIPSVIAAYDDQGVVLGTRLIEPRQALVQALSLTKQIRTSLTAIRYLQPPDVARLRANINRLNGSKRGAGSRLAELLKLEYAALGKASQSNPANIALNSALAKGTDKVNVLIISRRNHDAEALAFAKYRLTEKGYRVLTPELLNGRAQ